MFKIYYVECDDDHLIEKQFYINEFCAIFKRGNGHVNNFFDYEDYKVWRTTSSHEDVNKYAILTNDLDILEYGKEDFWNGENKYFKIYIWQNYNDGFANIHELTDKEIRPEHNIRKMYMNGAFRQYETKIR